MKLNHTHYGRGMPGAHCVLYPFTPKCVLGQGNLMSTSPMQSIAHFVIQNVFGQFLRCVSTPWLLYSIYPSENFTHVYIYVFPATHLNTFQLKGGINVLCVSPLRLCSPLELFSPYIA